MSAHLDVFRGRGAAGAAVLGLAAALALPGCLKEDDLEPPPAPAGRAPAPAAPRAGAEGAPRYRHTGMRFSLEPPAGWQEQVGTDGAIVTFLSPEAVARGPAGGAIRVDVVPEPAPNTAQAFQENVMGHMRSMARGFREHRVESLSLGGEPARHVEFSALVNDNPLHISIYFVCKGTRSYMLNCTATEAAWAGHAPVFQKVAASFRPE